LPTKKTLYEAHLHPKSKIYQTAVIAASVKHLEMAEDSFIGDFCFISVPMLILDKGAQVNSGTRILGQSYVRIGEYATVGYGCTLLTSSDTPRGKYMNDAAPLRLRQILHGPITIGERAFVGSHSVLMPNSYVPEGTVLRAFSYLDRVLGERDAVYGGQPSKLIKSR